MQYVIIGNSTAAIGAVEGIRTIDTTSPITIISNETHHTYSRPLISYLLAGKTNLQKMKYRPDDFYAKNNCTFLSGHTVSSIDSKKKTVTVQDGEGNAKECAYDRLLAATGSVPFVPPMQGLESVQKKFTFMTLDSAVDLDKALFPEAKVLIIGAGLIGLKCAEGIHGKCAEIAVVDLAPRILSSILDVDAAPIMQKHLEANGVKFYLEESVDAFTSSSAKLKSGTVLDFDILVLAVGVRPETSLIKNAGGEVNRGVVISETMATSLKDVWCAGDCSEGFDATIDGKRILALLPNAYMQGECAGINMAGGSSSHLKGIPMNAIGFFGLHITTAGSYTGSTYVKIDAEKNEYKKLFYENDLLKGFIIMGTIDKCGIYTSLIRNKVPLSTIDFPLVCANPGLIAFGRDVRKKVLGGI